MGDRPSVISTELYLDRSLSRRPSFICTNRVSPRPSYILTEFYLVDQVSPGPTEFYLVDQVLSGPIEFTLYQVISRPSFISSTKLYLDRPSFISTKLQLERVLSLRLNSMWTDQVSCRPNYISTEFRFASVKDNEIHHNNKNNNNNKNKNNRIKID